MPRKKVVKETNEIKEVNETCNKQEIVNLLKARIPSLFDREPMGSMSQSGLEKLVDEICQLN
jgi:hypothetical protein